MNAELIRKTNALETDATAIESRADALVVENEATQMAAGDALKDIKRLRVAVAELLDTPIKAAHAAHKAICEVRNKLDRPLSRAEHCIKKKVSDWQYAEQRRRDAERQRLEAEAREAEETRRLEQAAQLERTGDKENAERVLAEPVIHTPVTVKDVPKIKGVSVRERWTFRIVAVDLIPREYMIPNETVLGSLARSTKGKLKIPGVEFYNAPSVAVSP